LEDLKLAQAGFASDGDGIIAALRILSDREAIIAPIYIGKLFEACRAIAKDEHFLIPATVQGFGQCLSHLKQAIELELNVEFREDRIHANGRLIIMLPIASKNELEPLTAMAEATSGEAGEAGDNAAPWSFEIGGRHGTRLGWTTLVMRWTKLDNVGQ
jgi:hypothetical protein